MARQSYLGGIQALRFFAATSVLIAHVEHELLGRASGVTLYGYRIFIDGGIGVDVFFVISGFIMHHVAGEKFGQADAALDFIKRRVLRVVPLYYLATALILLTMVVLPGQLNQSRPSPSHVISSLLFLPHADSAGQIAPVLKLGWTLNYEAWFYLIFTISLFFKARNGLTVLFSTIIGMIALSMLVDGDHPMLRFWGADITLEFLAGVLISRAYNRGVRLTHRLSWTVIALGLLFALAVQAFGIVSHLPRSIYHGIPAALVVAGVALGPLGQSRSRLRSWLEVGGDASYALYLFHPFAIRGVLLLWNLLGLGSHAYVKIAVIMCVAIVSAVIINKAVERPLDRWLRRRYFHS